MGEFYVLKPAIWERSWWMAYFGVVRCGAMLVLLLLELLVLMLLYCVALGLAGLVVSTPRRAYSCVLLLYHTHINQSTLSSPSEELACLVVHGRRCLHVLAHVLLFSHCLLNLDCTLHPDTTCFGVIAGLGLPRGWDTQLC